MKYVISFNSFMEVLNVLLLKNIYLIVILRFPEILLCWVLQARLGNCKNGYE